MNVKAIQRVKQLCGMSINGQMLLPTLLPELRKVIPSYSSTFLWVDDDYKFTNTYDESPDVIKFAEIYHKEFLDNRDKKARPSLKTLLASNKGTISSEQFVYGNFFRSEFYNEIWRPLKYHHSLMVGVKTHHYPLGVLFLHRSKNDPPFTRKEEQILDELVPYIAQALRQESGVEMLFTSSDKAGLLIFTKEGKLQHICPEGRRLLFLATHPVISKESLTGQSDKVIVPNELINLCSQLTALPKEQYGLIKAPVWKHQNQWGGFQFIPNWLEPHAGDSDGLVAVTIQYQEPQNFKVLRRCDELNLTAKQAEIGLKLVEGHSYETIAQQLKISQHTVIDHVKNIYTKLHIRSRSELIALLISS